MRWCLTIVVKLLVHRKLFSDGDASSSLPLVSQRARHRRGWNATVARHSRGCCGAYQSSAASGNKG